MPRKSKTDWVAVIEGAARADVPIREYCQSQEVSIKQFYKEARKLGYIESGNRTQKWTDAAALPIQPSRLSLVPVPASTVRTAATREQEHTGSSDSEITISCGVFRVTVTNGFDAELLRAVLEVVADA